VADVGARADRVLTKLRPIEGNVLVFSSSHFLRVLGARWLGFDASGGRYFVLATAALSILGYEHNRAESVVRLWNDCRHAGE
jgi:probable phosphoglycerate mutase